MKIPEHDHLAQITKRLRTSSAVVPSLIFSAIALPVGTIGLVFGSEELQTFFQAVIGVPILTTIFQILFFTFVDRDRLQNEDHVERKMLLSGLRPELGDAHAVIDLKPEDQPTGNPALEGKV